MATSLIDTTREDLVRSLEARAFALEQGAEGPRRSAVLTRVISRIDEARSAEFRERLCALLKEFEAADADDDADADADADLQAYALTVAYYPSYHYSEP